VANKPLRVWKNESLRAYSRVAETEDDFRERCTRVADDEADTELAKLMDRFQARIDRVREEMATAQARFNEADAVAAAKSQESILGTAGDLLGAFLGGKSGSTALNKAAGRRTATAKATAKAVTAQAKYQERVAELDELEQDLAEEISAITSSYQELATEIETLEIPLEKTDIRVVDVKLVWVPIGRDPSRDGQTVSISALSRSRMETTPKREPSSSTTGRWR
jgi:hypothetical protein